MARTIQHRSALLKSIVRKEEMKVLERIFKETESPDAFVRGYFSYLAELLERFDVQPIIAFINELENARRRDATIFIAGNGGSAATAQHMANDLGVDVMKKGKPDRPFRAMALTDNSSVMTAIANDEGYENLFVYQLRVHYRPDDMLVAISASGNSPNVVEAAQWVKARDGRIVTITGFDGGKLKCLADIAIHVDTPKGEFGPVEDLHLIVDHVVANWLLHDSAAHRKDRVKDGNCQI